MRAGPLGPSLGELRMNLRFEAFEAAVEQDRKQGEYETRSRVPHDSPIEGGNRSWCLFLPFDVTANVEKPHRRGTAQACAHLEAKGTAGLRRNEGIVMPVYGTVPRPRPRLSTAG